MNRSPKSTKIGQMLLKLFKQWHLSPHQQQCLLGLPSDSSFCIREYLCEKPLNVDREKFGRISTLIDIHNSLCLLFPRNRSLAYRWMQQPNHAFEGQTPIETIERQGMQGMYLVCGYLHRQLAGEDLTLTDQIKASPNFRRDLDKEVERRLSGTAASRESSNSPLEDGADGVLQLLDVWLATVRTFTSEETARDWIKTYVPALGSTPVTLLTTMEGRNRVLSVLKRIEQGDFGG